MTSATSVLAHSSMRALLSGAIDYAGLFPPAGLDMASAVSNYAQYRDSRDAWALGSFVLPIARLDELVAAASPRWQASGGETPWRLSVLAGIDPAADGAQISAFNAAFENVARIESLESRASTPLAVSHLAGCCPGMQHFVEIPLSVDLPPMVSAVRAIGASAKMRTGGVTPDAFPATRDVARFLGACADAGIAFKATAGLHHPIRREYRLTYEPNSARGTMFGYFNVFLAAALALDGATVDQMLVTLEGRSTAMLGIVDEEIRWEGLRVSTARLQEVRASFARSFGSCSFREPLDDLETLFA